MRVAITRQPVPYVGGKTVYGTWTVVSFNMTGSTTTGLVAGQYVNCDASTFGLTPATEDTISSITNTTTFVYGATHATTNQTQKKLNVSDVKGALVSGTNTITLSFRGGATVSISSILQGDFITGNGLPASTRVISVNTGTSVITISNVASRTGQAALTFSR